MCCSSLPEAYQSPLLLMTVFFYTVICVVEGALRIAEVLFRPSADVCYLSKMRLACSVSPPEAYQSPLLLMTVFVYTVICVVKCDLRIV
jgi:hypothetical protein